MSGNTNGEDFKLELRSSRESVSDHGGPGVTGAHAVARAGRLSFGIA